jgi:iron complex outermembrane receptor protein
MSSKFMVALCATAAIVGLIGARGAVAQQADQQTAANAGGGLEEIVVTARRKEERLQSVPLAITAFSQADLDKQHIQEVRDLGRTVPSLAISNSQSDANAPYSSQTRLRGLPGSVVYFAEVPLGTTDYDTTTGLTHGLSTGFYYDLENLQVLKGPQGTLFGKNSIGGLISIEPKKPTNNFEGYGQVTFGNYGDKEFEGAVNIPVVDDKLLVRIAGQRQERDGYTKDYYTGKDLDNRDYYSWRVSVTARPTDDFQDDFIYDGYYQDSNGSSTILRYVNPKYPLSGLNSSFQPVPLTVNGKPNPACMYTVTLGAAGAGAVPGGCGSSYFGLYPNVGSLAAEQQELGARTELGHSVQGIGKDYFYGFTNTSRWDISDELTLKNIAAARIFKQLSTTDDFGAGNLPVLNIGVPGNNQQWGDNSVQYTEELQLQGKALNDKLSWVAGGYLEFDHPLGDTLLGSTAAGTTSYYHFHETARSQAAFAHGIYDLSDYVDGLKFTAGYRYTWDRITDEEQALVGADAVTRNAAGAPTNCGVQSGVDNNCHISAGGDFSSYGWNVGLDEQLDSKTLIYVRSGNAYRPGGFNLNVPAQFAKFQPEHVTDVEIGMKTDWDYDGLKGRINADVFHTDYKNIQVTRLIQVQNPNGTSRVASLLFNAAAAELEGAELETSIVPFEGFEIAPHLSYLYTDYGQYPADAGAVSKDPPFLYTPKLQYAVTGTYHLPIDESWGDVAVSATYSWYGHQYVSVQLGEIDPIQPSYDDLDVRVDWTNIMGNPVDAGFFMTNALDSTHEVGAFPIYSQLGFTSLVYNEPRMFGFSLKYRFGGPSEPEAEPAAYTPPPVQAPAPKAPKSYLVFFDFNRSDLTAQAVQIVDQAAANAGPAKVTQLTVTGHTDTVGSDTYNMRLSRRRAESVAAQLEKDGIPSGEIEIVAKGKRDLLVQTADGVREPQNRRVQIIYAGGPTS